jgi:hypothetical protein
MKRAWWWSKRWLKLLLRIDPLVGMYFVYYSQIGIVLGRIQGGAEPKYLVRWLAVKFENYPVVELSRDFLYTQYAFFYSRKEAERWRDWRYQLPAFQAEQQPIRQGTWWQFHRGSTRFPN